MKDKVGVAGMFEQDINYDDSTNDLIDGGVDIGSQWRKVKLNLLVQQVQHQLYFLWGIVSKRQVIKR